jgi:hypothetical protein
MSAGFNIAISDMRNACGIRGAFGKLTWKHWAGSGVSSLNGTDLKLRMQMHENIT